MGCILLERVDECLQSFLGKRQRGIRHVLELPDGQGGFLEKLFPLLGKLRDHSNAQFAHLTPSRGSFEGFSLEHARGFVFGSGFGLASKQVFAGLGPAFLSNTQLVCPVFGKLFGQPMSKASMR